MQSTQEERYAHFTFKDPKEDYFGDHPEFNQFKGFRVDVYLRNRVYVAEIRREGAEELLREAFYPIKEGYPDDLSPDEDYALEQLILEELKKILTKKNDTQEDD